MRRKCYIIEKRDKKGKILVEIISVIVPIYNVEQYLSRCLDSILNQTYKALEIILVNDGSKDGSLQICQKYAARDSRIKVIDKPNEGVSVTRNVGLQAATGVYVGFIDPDDWIEPTMYEDLYRRIKKTDAPICLCNFYKDSKHRSVSKRFKFKKEFLGREDIIKEIINPMIGIEDITPTYTYVMGCVWRGLYERAFLEQHQLRFEPSVSIMEDLVFMVQALVKCPSICIHHGVYYHYIQNPKSALHTYNQKMWQDQLKVHELLEECLEEAGLEEEVRNRLDMRYLGMVFGAIKNEALGKQESDFKNTLSTIKHICTDDKLRIVLERVKPIQKSTDRSEKVEKIKVKKVKKIKKSKKHLRKKHFSRSLQDE